MSFRIGHIVAVGAGLYVLYQLGTRGLNAAKEALSFRPMGVDVGPIEGAMATVTIRTEITNRSSIAIPASSFSGHLYYRSNSQDYRLSPVRISDQVSWGPGQTKVVDVVANVNLFDVFGNAAALIESGSLGGGNFFIKGYVRKGDLSVPITKQL